MHEHFNNLNPLQHELLTKLMEESSEIIQVCSKIMLHGLESTEPGSQLTNRDKLHNEIGDLLFFIEQACKNRLLAKKYIQEAVTRRASRTNHYLHHVEVE